MTPSTTDQSAWSVLSLLNWSAEHLYSKGFENARLNAELLLSRVLRCKRIDVYLNFDAPLNPDQLAEFKSLFTRRLAHEPLQYILGETEFMGLPFASDPRALIPRPETEVLVEQVIDHARRSPKETVNILDIGTGSGNIAVSLAYHLPNSTVVAVDSSADALRLAQENARRNAMEERVEFQCVDVMKDPCTLPHHSFDYIVSNPPYISHDEFMLLQPEVKDFEPVTATTDHADGLTFYHRIAEIGEGLLHSDGTVAVEMAYDQSTAVVDIFSGRGYKKIETIKDYSGIVRVLTAHSV